MYINDLPFHETLQQAQKDLYDINTLLLEPMKKQEKISKRKKIMWGLISGTEHSIGITFGVLAAMDIYEQRYIPALLYVGLMAIAATAGFNSGNISNEHNHHARQARNTIKKVENIVSASLPEQLHEIAETIRNNKKQR